MGFCSKALKNEFETAVVNEPPVFEPLHEVLLYFHPKVYFRIRLTRLLELQLKTKTLAEAFTYLVNINMIILTLTFPKLHGP